MLGTLESQSLTLLHGVDQLIEVLDAPVVFPFHLHAVIGSKLLGVLAVAHEVLVVELQVLHDLPVFFWFHGLQLNGGKKNVVLIIYPNILARTQLFLCILFEIFWKKG